MAIKKIYMVDEKKYVKEEEIEFKAAQGFSVDAKQKSVNALKEAITASYENLNILDISKLNGDELASLLNPQTMKYNYHGIPLSIYNIYYGAQVFDKGGPYLDMFVLDSKLLKKDRRLTISGKLKQYNFDGYIVKANTKPVFYDFISCKCIYQNKAIANRLINFDVFFDYEQKADDIYPFSRALAIYTSLYNSDKLEEALKSVEDFTRIVYKK